MLDLDGIAEFFTFGLTLDGKTMRKGLSIPPLLSMSDVENNGRAGIDDVYRALKDSMERLIQPGAGLALSGGLDSRVVAGITSELGEIPTFTWGYSNFEKKIAHKVASVLKLPHYVINADMRMNEENIEKLKYFVMKTGGTMSVHGLHIKTCLSERLKEHDINMIISAFGFDEINGSDFGYKVNSSQKFCDVFVKTYAHPWLPHEYQEIAKRNLNECCNGMAFSKIYPLIYVGNIYRDFKVEEWVTETTPTVNKEVMSTIISLPYKQRINKRMQKELLRRYFPKLYNIPYAMSGLSPFIPHLLHIYMRKLIRVLCGFVNQEKHRPLLTFDCQWLMRNSLPFMQELLFSNVPPFMSRKTLQKLIYRLKTKGSIRDGVFLDKLSTYALLASQIN